MTQIIIVKSKSKKNIEKNILIKISGLVQGVGFRPFIYVLAKKYDLKGWVENRSDGVLIEVNNNDKIDEFISAIIDEAPKASNIHSIEISEINYNEYSEFYIKKSETNLNEITEISPDIAVCDKCLDDMKQQQHRIDYPFINCTNCGPRFSIIKELPYDRDKTTMHEFEMCDACKSEYENVYDRRFHAQPVACNNCGPEYNINEDRSIQSILDKINDVVRNDRVFALKGLGGYHLGCDAYNNNAVEKLREVKKRDGKPFAIMCKDIESIKKIANINEKEIELLQSWKSPIVLLELKHNDILPNGISVELDKIGVMLPYMPFHYLMFENLDTDAIVLTSGNISKEPIIIDNEKANSDFSTNVDLIIDHNRDIYNRTDDSVAFIAAGKERIIRRSRGYAPSPIRTELDLEGIFAAGAELVNVFGIGKGKQAILSQHIGDLQNMETMEFYEETFSRYKQLFMFEPQIAVCDMHPDYLSTKFAESLDIELIKVQHHHAHIASCMLENGIDDNVIGISLDGTGYGTDGNIWGGEFMIADLNDFHRCYHFDYLAIPGGDLSTKQPWRSGISMLYRSFGKNLFDLDLEIIKKYENKIDLLIQAIDKKINTPLSSSAGRLFDAVSAILGLCYESKFHAEAPMRLESIVDKNISESYNYTIDKDKIKIDVMLIEMIEDIKSKVNVSIISAKFHNMIIDITYNLIHKLSDDYGLKTAALSGGTFQNKYLLEKLEYKFLNSHINLLTQSKVPSNDGGIALGQLAIGAKRREMKCV